MIFFFVLLLFANAQTPGTPAESGVWTTEEDTLFTEGGGSLVKRLTEPFIYDRSGKRDPFLLPETKEAPLLPGAYFGPFLAIQELKLKNITIKGIIMDPVKPKALISYKNEKDEVITQTLRVGDYLGENFGVVQAIRDGKIIIVQTLGEGDKKSTSTITLSIRK
jgi:Tfp pilus assembly protein PilP